MMATQQHQSDDTPMSGQDALDPPREGIEWHTKAVACSSCMDKRWTDCDKDSAPDKLCTNCKVYVGKKVNCGFVRHKSWQDVLLEQATLALKQTTTPELAPPKPRRVEREQRTEEHVDYPDQPVQAPAIPERILKDAYLAFERPRPSAEALSARHKAKPRAARHTQGFGVGGGQHHFGQAQSGFHHFQAPPQAPFQQWAAYPQQPHSAGYNQQPHNTGYNQQPYNAGYNQQPYNAGYNQQPHHAGYNTQQYGSGYAQQQNGPGYGGPPSTPSVYSHSGSWGSQSSGQQSNWGSGHGQWQQQTQPTTPMSHKAANLPPLAPPPKRVDTRPEDVRPILGGTQKTEQDSRKDEHVARLDSLPDPPANVAPPEEDEDALEERLKARRGNRPSKVAVPAMESDTFEQRLASRRMGPRPALDPASRVDNVVDQTKKAAAIASSVPTGWTNDAFRTLETRIQAGLSNSGLDVPEFDDFMAYVSSRLSEGRTVDNVLQDVAESILGLQPGDEQIPTLVASITGNMPELDMDIQKQSPCEHSGDQVESDAMDTTANSTDPPPSGKGIDEADNGSEPESEPEYDSDGEADAPKFVPGSKRDFTGEVKLD